MKEIFLSNLRTALFGRIPTEEISEVMDIVTTQLGKYDLKVKPTEIVVYDYGDAEMLKKFFIAKATEGLTEGSIRTYRQAIANALTKIGKHVRNITSDDIRLLLASMRLNKKSAAYMNLVRRSLNSFFGWITKEELIIKNPMLRIASIRETKKVRQPFTEEELERLRQSAGSTRNKCIVEFLYSTGCRVSEMCGINRDDLNFTDSQVLVLGKGKKYRMVYFSARCKVLLQEYLSQRQDSESALFVSDYEGFRSNKEAPVGRLSMSGVEDMIRKIGKRAGIKGVGVRSMVRKARELGLEKDGEWLLGIWQGHIKMAHMMSRAKGYPGRIMPGEHRNPEGEFKAGSVHSQEERRKISEGNKRNWMLHRRERRAKIRRTRGLDDEEKTAFVS